jgi:hypothetical protein
LLIKSLTSCTSKDINLSKTVQRTAMRAPTRVQESEGLAPYSTPCQQKAAKRPTLCPIPDPQSLPPSLLKKKWGNDRVVMLPFCESAKMAAPPFTEIPTL